METLVALHFHSTLFVLEKRSPNSVDETFLFGWSLHNIMISSATAKLIPSPRVLVRPLLAEPSPSSLFAHA